MRMARVNITVPDEIMHAARAAGLNVSRLASVALAEELDRQQKVAALDAYLADLQTALGPIGVDEAASAERWVDSVLAGQPAPMRSRRRPRSA
jgi:post-segregation antitoxin (ccd killing protein)